MFPVLPTNFFNQLLSVITNMDSTIASGRKVRARRKVNYREPSSSSSDDPFQSLQHSPSRSAKRKREASLQTQNSSNSGNPPLAPDRLYTGPHQGKGPSRESETSDCSLGSDVPIFPYLEGKSYTTREHSDSSLSSLASDASLFQYLRQKRLHTGQHTAPQPSSPTTTVVYATNLKDIHLALSKTKSSNGKEDPKLDTVLLSEFAVFEDPIDSPAPDYFDPFDPRLQHQKFLQPITRSLFTRVRSPNPVRPRSVVASPFARVTTSNSPGSPSVHINQKRDMAPTVSKTLIVGEILN